MKDTKKNILIVEDDRLMLQMISMRLKDEGYHIMTAQNGSEALDIIDTEKVNLIISDIMMPEICGLSLLSLVNRYYHRRIPVILISSLDNAEVVLSSMGLGTTDFMAKPLDFEKLSEKIKKALFTEKEFY